ncbi:MAG: RloB domain-containing protein [Vampirovibrio sp.]|nr:RloB domain-containing protein [Vampirovibrio sp.]
MIATYAILCEGETEEYYFSKLLGEKFHKIAHLFKVDFKTGKQQPIDLDTHSIYPRKTFPNATDIKSLQTFGEELISFFGFKKVFVVFDRDDNAEVHLQQVIDTDQMVFFYSNACFEYWFHLYEEHLNTEHPLLEKKEDGVFCQQSVIKVLKTYPRFNTFKKGKQSLHNRSRNFSWLYEEQQLNQAISRATERFEEYKATNSTVISRYSDPITTIHHLIEALETLEQQQETITL